MSIFKKFKEAYKAIEIPQELDYAVNSAIHKKTNIKRKKFEEYSKIAISSLVTSFTLFIILLNTNESFAKSMESIPVISGLAKVFTVKEYKEDTELDLIEAKIPAITNTGNADLEDRINYEISTKIDAIINEAKERAKEYQKAVLDTGGKKEDLRPIQINIDYEITYQDEEIISFVITKSESLASAYEEQYFYNIDIQNGKELNLKDVLGEDYKAIVNEEVKKQIKERTKADENNIYFKESEGGFSGIENEYQNFYINSEKKVEIVFQKYEIAPGYMGIQNFEIPNNMTI